MAGRIVFTNADQTSGRIEHAGGVFFGPIPPLAGEERGIYDRLIAAGVEAEAYIAPDPPRRLVPKSLVISRLSNEQIEAILAILTAKQAERWRAPDQPAVYADDPDMVAVLTAIGADLDAILAP